MSASRPGKEWTASVPLFSGRTCPPEEYTRHLFLTSDDVLRRCVVLVDNAPQHAPSPTSEFGSGAGRLNVMPAIGFQPAPSAAGGSQVSCFPAQATSPASP